MDELSTLLEKGIEAKRKEDYDIALDYLEKAKEINPFDRRIFLNVFRILIGLERYEDALRNLLIMACTNRLLRLIEVDLKSHGSNEMLEEFKGRY